MRNIYDNSDFFAAYAEMGRSKDGLKAAGEWVNGRSPVLGKKSERIFLRSFFF